MWRIFVTNFCDEILWWIFVTNICDEYLWRTFVTNFFDQFFWQIFWQIFLTKFLTYNFLGSEYLRSCFLSNLKVLIYLQSFHNFFLNFNRCSTAERAGYYLDAALTSRSTNMAADLTGRDSHFIFSLHVYQYSVST